MRQEERLQQELELEKAMYDRGIDRWLSDYNAHKDKNRLHQTTIGQQIIGGQMLKLSNAIEEWMEQAKGGVAYSHATAIKLIKDVSPKLLAFLTLRMVVASLTYTPTLVRVASRIGTAIRDELVMDEVKKENKNVWAITVQGANGKIQDIARDSYARRNKDKYIDYDKWTRKECVHVGVKLLDILQETCGLIERVSVRTGKKTYTYIHPLPELLDWMNNQADFLSKLHPVYEPMIVRPRRWTNPYDGGYLSPEIKRIYLIKRTKKHVYDMASKEDMPIVYDAVNAIQETAWQVNTFVLDVLLHFWEKNVSIAGLPHKEGIPLPPKPWDIDTNEEAKKAWVKAAASVYRRNAANSSKLCQFNFSIDIAKRYRDYKKFYNPCQVDFRGRIYPISPLNCQGTDFIKALLRFANGKPLGSEGWKWLAIQGANLVGNDKISFDERIQFILDNEATIRAIVEDPLNNRQWCGEVGGIEVESPWCFLGWCQEWVGYLTHGESYVSKLPVAMDGSCSGLQHFSAMLRDEKVGEAVNLLPSDKPSDVYKLVAEEVVRLVDVDIENGTEDALVLKEGEEVPVLKEGTKSFAKQWTEFGINRKLTKRAVMTLCYGSKRYGFGEQLMEDFILKTLNDGKTIPFKSPRLAVSYMADKIWKAVGKSLTKAQEAMEWLQQVARIAAGENKPVLYRTPIGFPVMHSYYKSKEERIATSLRGGTRIRVHVATETEDIDSRKQGSAVSPNFVHSYDATHMMMVTAEAKKEGIDSFAMIHDSFGCPAGDAPKMFKIIREQMVNLYSNHDPLQIVRDAVQAEVTEELPELPTKGSLDLNHIRESLYCFA